MSSMSEASMPFQPAIDEPSNAWPDVNLSSSKCETGTLTCCSLPRVSVKRKSTNLISFSLTIDITSATVLAIWALLGFLGEFGRACPTVVAEALRPHRELCRMRACRSTVHSSMGSGGATPGNRALRTNTVRHRDLHAPNPGDCTGVGPEQHRCGAPSERRQRDRAGSSVG